MSSLVQAWARWLAVALASVPLFVAFPLDLEAKKPGAQHCYRQVCVRVRSIKETEKLVGKTLTITTSHYGDPRTDRFNTGRYTSNGERFSADDGSRTASADFPDGTELLLRNPENGRVSHVRVNDFGPFMGSRRLDVTQQVARDLGFFHLGVLDLEVTVLAAPTSDDHPNLYRRNRQTPATGGFMGRYSEIEVAGLAHELIQSSRRKLMARDSAVLALVSSIVPPRRKPENDAQLVVAGLQPEANQEGPGEQATNVTTKPADEGAINADDVGNEAPSDRQAPERAPGSAGSNAEERSLAQSPANSQGGSEAAVVLVDTADAVPETLAARPAVLTPAADDAPASTTRPTLINATSADAVFARNRTQASLKLDDHMKVVAAKDVEVGPVPAPRASARALPVSDRLTVAVEPETSIEVVAPSQDRQMALALDAAGEGGIAGIAALQSASPTSERYADQRRGLAGTSQVQFLALLAAIFAATVSIYAFGNIALGARAAGSSQPRMRDGDAGYAKPHDWRQRHASPQPPFVSRPMSALSTMARRMAFAKARQPGLGEAGLGEAGLGDDGEAPLPGLAYRQASTTAQRAAAGVPAPVAATEPTPVVEVPKALPSAAHETLIGEGVTIESDIASDEAVYITGEVVGNVSGRRVEIAAGAVVRGHIAADHAIIDGRLTGNVDARELTVLRHGVMSGNARIEVLSVEPGARVDVAFTFLRPEKVA